MTELLTDAESDALIEQTMIVCLDTIFEMRSKGAGPADMMSALTRVNVGVIVYCIANGKSGSTPGGVIRTLASLLKEEVPTVLQKYERAKEQVGTA